jgi:ferredoxin
MTYLVTDNCIKCKHTDCVAVCPVDCFYEGEHMLVINPLECIDCGVCVPECPADAILQDTELKGAEHDKWYSINEYYSNKWENITEQKDPPPDAADFDGIPNKYEQYMDDDEIPVKEIT